MALQKLLHLKNTPEQERLLSFIFENLNPPSLQAVFTALLADATASSEQKRRALKTLVALSEDNKNTKNTLPLPLCWIP